MKTACLFTFLFISSLAFAQNSRTRFSVGPELSLPTYKEFPSNGIGGSLSIQFKSKRRTSATIDVGYNYFSGDVVNYWFPDTIRGFGLAPVLAGAKFSATNKFYAAVRGGLTFGYNGFIGLTFSPAVGIMLPNKQNPRIDLGARWMGVLGVPTYPEKTFIEKGNYSYLNLRAAIVF
jgi:hypothetical protein